MAVIGVDVDGIVANFEAGYAPLLTQTTGIEFPRLGEAGWPDTWFWERAAGVTKEQESVAWDQIKASNDFWFNLPAHAGAQAFLDELAHYSINHDVYFITSRVGKHVKYQTESWLAYHGFEEATVLISSEKGLCCRALKVTHYIDDKNENCAQVVDQSPSTLCYMLAKPYNSIEAVPPSGNFGRIDTLQEFLDAITG